MTTPARSAPTHSPEHPLPWRTEDRYMGTNSHVIVDSDNMLVLVSGNPNVLRHICACVNACRDVAELEGKRFRQHTYEDDMWVLDEDPDHAS